MTNYRTGQKKTQKHDTPHCQSTFRSAAFKRMSLEDVVMTEATPSPPGWGHRLWDTLISRPLRFFTGPSAAASELARIQAEEQQKQVRWEIPQKKLPPTAHMQHRVVLLGQTGSGKSTLVNLLANYFRHGALTCNRSQVKVMIPNVGLKVTEHDAPQAVTNEAAKHLTSASQTRGCTEYEFHADDGHSYKFIDTPGLGDTGGIDQDDTNLNAISKALTEEKKISALVLVINGTDARVTAVLKMALTRIRASCPDTVMTNILIVLTNCTQNGINFDRLQLQMFHQAIPDKHFFYMDNSFFRTSTMTAQELATIYGPRWKSSMQQVNALREAIHSMDPSSTEDFIVMREHRMKLKVELAHVLDEISKLDQLRMNLINDNERKEKAEKMGLAHENFRQQQQQKEWKMDETPNHYHTTCMTHHKNCHEKCGLEEIAKSGSREFARCLAFSSGFYCQSCGVDEKCGFSNHMHSRYLWKEEIKTVEVVLEEMEKKHAQFMAEVRQANQEIDEHQVQMKLIDHALEEKTKGIEEIAEQLQEACTGVNLVEELSCVVDAMRYHAKVLVTQEAKDRVTERIKSIIILIDRLANKKSKSGSGSRLKRSHSSMSGAVSSDENSNKKTKACREIIDIE